MKTLQRLQAIEAVDGLLNFVLFPAKGHDPHAPIGQELAVRAALYDSWDRQVKQFSLLASHAMLGSYGLPSADKFTSALDQAFGGDALTRSVAVASQEAVATAFANAREEVRGDYKKQTGKAPPMSNVSQKSVMFGALFGLTEQHALQALNEQLIVAAGSFWDDQLQESIKTEVESWFAGTLTREDLVTKLSDLINTRLATAGKSMARSYFDNLATHVVNSARNTGLYYEGKRLGATEYTLYNPHDKKTSPICRAVTQGQVYSMGDAEGTVVAKLQARTSDDLKANAPFLTPETVHHAKGPVPPLHFPKCRTKMKMIF